MTPITFDYPISVAILYYGGEASDLEDTVESVKGIEGALAARGHAVRAVEVNARNWRRACMTAGEVVFNLVEDETWELYLKVGEMLERLGRAQVGQDRAALRYVVKKARIKRRMRSLGIGTPEFRVFNRRSRVGAIRGLEYPLIVKPSGQHAGIGISQDSVVIDEEELMERVKFLFKSLGGEVVAEEYIEGREIHVTVIGNGKYATPLPYCEIAFGGEFADNWNVYTYDAKWTKTSWEYWGARAVCPARVSRKLDGRLERLVMRAYRAFGCRDVVRFDVRVDANDLPKIVDINMNPSLNAYDSQDATLASVLAMGWTYEQFIETVVAITYKRKFGRLPDRMRNSQFLLAGPRMLG